MSTRMAGMRVSRSSSQLLACTWQLCMPVRAIIPRSTSPARRSPIVEVTPLSRAVVHVATPSAPGLACPSMWIEIRRSGAEVVGELARSRLDSSFCGLGPSQVYAHRGRGEGGSSNRLDRSYARSASDERSGPSGTVMPGSAVPPWPESR